MTDIRAIATGNWSSGSTWFNGQIPGSGDTAFANTFTVTIDSDRTCTAISTAAGGGGSAGGGFVLAAGVTFTGAVLAGTTPCLTFASNSPNVSNVVGPVTAGNGATCQGINHTGTGRLNVTGDVHGGNATSSGQGILLTAAGRCDVLGNCYGGQGSNGYGVQAGAAGAVLNVTGDAYGSDFAANFGVYASHAATTHIIGDCYGGKASSSYGANNFSTGTMTVDGDVHAGLGASAAGVNNQVAGGTLIVNGDVYAHQDAGAGTGLISTGTLTMVGNVYGGRGNGVVGVNLGSAAVSSTVTGDVYGGVGPANNGITVAGTHSLTVNGNVRGGGGNTSHGVSSTGSGTIVINGEAIGGTGTTCIGVNVTSTADVTVDTAVGNDFPFDGIPLPNPGTNAQGTSIVKIRRMRFGKGGMFPYTGRTLIVDHATNRALVHQSPNGEITTIGKTAADYPAESDVRGGSPYGGSLEGTVALPVASQVGAGVPVDGTVGTAALEEGDVGRAVAEYPTASAILGLGARVKNVATVDSTGAQLAALGGP